MTSETLMTETAATTTEGLDVSATAAPEGTQAPEGDGQQQTEGQAAKPEGESGKGQEGKPEGAPEKYEFTKPDGVQMDDAGIEAFADFAKSMNMTQEAAQKMLDTMAPAMAQRHEQAMEAARQQWADSTKADKEIGGDKLTESLAVAKKALDRFGTPELRTLLNDSGLGNHPEIVRLMVKAGKAISEDTFVSGGQAPAGGGKSKAEILYDNAR